ncbi:MAG TPA: hypothetical protein VFU77_04235 [Steroidobacteraceae bacterium]|nr:hypothetical protein [Steroidobacteraceae bacterium]
MLDLRFNTGGNPQLASPLWESLARSSLGSSPGAIAVLTPIPAGAQEHLHLNIDAQDLEPDVMVDGTWREYSSGADPVSAAVTGGPLRCTDD